ncbi:hypothetical protein M2352_000960 [Azospirillum fermentarium]|uniref:hypothetical protein n=1 Tax=Azospirillum fermentarium TaxID=1233114 RepID=UPI00222604E5|nr:hypothetical protein [Azospirillum fermentarium]MCW2245369.1 hypothetical protein [Azospirillum fermentarium]
MANRVRTGRVWLLTALVLPLEAGLQGAGAAGLGLLSLGAAGLGLPAVAAAQEQQAPSPDGVRQEAARRLPAPWAVQDVTLHPAGADGVAAVSVRVRLTQPTFAVERRTDEVAFLRPVADAGTEKVLTGTAAPAAGNGQGITLAFDNAEVLDSLGRPADQLPGRTVVAGTPDAAAAAEKLAAAAARKREADEQTADNALAETERMAQQMKLIAARTQQMDTVRARLSGGEPAARIAAFEAALGGDDVPLRQFALETAFAGRDQTLLNLALRDWLGRKKAVPVQLYATREEPASETVLRNLGPLTLEIQGFNTVSGNLVGRLGAAGYTITMPSAASGYLAQNELTINSFGCSLTLRLTEHRTFDGLYRCQTLPALVARIVLD